jgi:hypothetical protein
MGCFSPTQPGNLNYGKIMNQTLQTQVGLQPLLQASEAQWDPFQTNQSLSNLNDLLFGSQGGSYDVQTFTPAVTQTGNKLGYAGVPKGFLGEVNKPPLGAGSMTFDAATGMPIAPHRAGDGSTGLGITGSSAGDATVLGGPLGMGFGQFADTGNPDPLSSALGVDFFGGSSTRRIAPPKFGTRTVTQGAQPGLVDLMAKLNTATRSANVNDLATLGPDALAALRTSNPQMAALMDQLNGQASDELTAGSGLTPDEQRMMQQATRASWAARGLDGTNASASDEVLRQYALGQQLLRQRQQFAQGVVGQQQQVYQDPILAMLSQNGQGASAQAQSLLPGNMFNPESPFAGNIASANQQMAALFADPSTLSKINQVGSTVSNTIGSIASIAGGVAGI